MPNDDTPEPPDMAPDAAVDTPAPNPGPDHTDKTAGASQAHDEASVRALEGLPPDAVILAPPLTSPPMRCPDEVWAMLILAVDIIGDTDPDRAGEAALFAGSWVPEQPPADLYDGDLVLRLTCPQPGPTYEWHVQHANIEMLLAYHGRWQRVGQWCDIDDRWPHTAAPTAAAVMGLYNDAAEEVARRRATPSLASSPYRWAHGGVAELLEAGLVKMGDNVVWNRRNLGIRHTARICVDGTLILADGRRYANPSGATTALGGNHQNGWHTWRRLSDGRTLDELRTELRALRGSPMPQHARHARPVPARR